MAWTACLLHDAVWSPKRVPMEQVAAKSQGAEARSLMRDFADCGSREQQQHAGGGDRLRERMRASSLFCFHEKATFTPLVYWP